MIDLYYWTSPNTQKVLILLEETGLEYRLIPVNITQGQQFDPEFVKISPNSRLPVIVDHDPGIADNPITLFESAAILIYLAERTGRFFPTDPVKRLEVLQWLFWQVGGLGPIGGQIVHFRNYAPYPVEYALERYGKENDRLLGVLDARLTRYEFVVDEYSIADMACFPWIYAHFRRDQIDLARWPAIERWFRTIRERPAALKAYEIMFDFAGGSVVKNQSMLDTNARRILFGDHAVAP